MCKVFIGFSVYLNMIVVFLICKFLCINYFVFDVKFLIVIGGEYIFCLIRKLIVFKYEVMVLYIYKESLKYVIMYDVILWVINVKVNFF